MGGGTAALVLAVPLAACGGRSSNVVRPLSTPSNSASTGRSSPVSSSAPGTSSASRTTAPAGRQTVTVTPHSGLHDGQEVRVEATGFSPNEPLQVIQCADKGNATGPGDCNLSGMLSVSSDASGKLQVRLKVLRGPFGTNRSVCSGAQRCLVSVTQAAMQPTEEADAPISFSG
ncbi:MAG TPA: neocarzinostatin apoprotein domain-containing protein [Jatrophihabitans sp.]|nr:neocarzinostatin apoprotein domain-containing protein [Jatrophihabitans sp.]